MRKFFSILFLLTTTFVLAQKQDTALWKIKAAENELKEIQKCFLSRNEAIRIEGNKKFIKAWEKIISNPSCLQYDFDSLKEISILSPKNKKFKIITWNLHLDNGNHAYFGYLLVDNSKRIKTGLFKHKTIQEYDYFQLFDQSSAVKNPESYVGAPNKWFGMLYTSLIECDGYYTLIGWDGNDKLTQRKFIDVLYFKADGTPVFGKDVFKIPRKSNKRMMFEYSSEVTMSLRYNEKQNRIVYSHLAPKSLGNVLEGQYQYYGPDGSFDALELKKDKWVVIEDIDARNEKNKNEKADVPNPKDQKPLFTPK